MNAKHHTADPGDGGPADAPFRPHTSHAVTLGVLWVVVIVLVVAVDLTK